MIETNDSSTQFKVPMQWEGRECEYQAFGRYKIKSIIPSLNTLRACLPYGFDTTSVVSRAVYKLQRVK